MRAAASNHLSVASLLLERKADVNGTSPDGDSALHQACQEGHTEMVELLLKHKPRVDTWGFRQSTPLMRAAASSKNALQCVQLLLKHGAHVNLQAEGSGDTPLHIAAQEGKHELVAALLSKGADANIAGNKGSTALMRASLGGHVECVRHLLKAKANVHLMASAVEEEQSKRITFVKKGNEAALLVQDRTMKFRFWYSYLCVHAACRLSVSVCHTNPPYTYMGSIYPPRGEKMPSDGGSFFASKYDVKFAYSVLLSSQNPKGRPVQGPLCPCLS